MRHARTLPRLILGASLFDNPAPDRNDQACVFRERDELVWTHEALGWVLPAKQRFHADDASIRKIHLGLVIKCELTTRNGLSQIVLHREPFRKEGAHFGS